MKWSDLPMWLKVIVIVVSIVLIYHAVKALINYVSENKKEWYRQWLVKQNEIRALLFEKQRISVLLRRAKRYARIALLSLKATLLLAFIGFSYSLVIIYEMDFFNAFCTSGGTVVTIYYIIVCMLDRKIRSLNELHDMTAKALERLYQKRFKVEPNRIIIIDSKLEELRKEAGLLKKKLRS